MIKEHNVLCGYTWWKTNLELNHTSEMKRNFPFSFSFFLCVRLVSGSVHVLGVMVFGLRVWPCVRTSFLSFSMCIHMAVNCIVSSFALFVLSYGWVVGALARASVFMRLAGNGAFCSTPFARHKFVRQHFKNATSTNTIWFSLLCKPVYSNSEIKTWISEDHTILYEEKKRSK